jgi:hypothetical protein
MDANQAGKALFRGPSKQKMGPGLEMGPRPDAQQWDSTRRSALVGYFRAALPVKDLIQKSLKNRANSPLWH